MNKLLISVIINLFVSIDYCQSNDKKEGNHNEDSDPRFEDNWNVTFNLFTRRNRQQLALSLDSSDSDVLDSGFNAGLRTKLIVHGWQSSYNGSNLFGRRWMQDMKDYILDAIDCNVFCIDWSEAAKSPDYLSVLPNVSIVGRMISNFIDRLIKIFKASPNYIHCIGHSLGAHVCGFAGKGQKNNKLAEITGLDPARPGFEKDDSSTRLDRSDANLVIVSHTSSGFDVCGDVNVDGFIGNPDSLGHFDFRFNGGNQQPLCYEFRHTLDALRDIVELKLKNAISETEKVGFCPHESAYIYPIVRPNNDCQFIAYLCDDYEDFEAGKCADDSKPIELNFDFYDNPSHGLNASEGPNNLFIKTGASYPYCLFHYQIILQLKTALQSSQTAKVSLLGLRRIDFEMRLASKGQNSFTYLHVDSEELGQLTGATVSGVLEVDALFVNFMSHNSQKVRRKKSLKIKVISTNQTEDNTFLNILKEIV